MKNKTIVDILTTSEGHTPDKNKTDKDFKQVKEKINHINSWIQQISGYIIAHGTHEQQQKFY